MTNEPMALRFERLSPYIASALEYADGSHTLADVREALFAGRLQFWPGPNSVVLTEIIATPQQKHLNFFLIGGDFEELQQAYPLILEWGRKSGCVRATGVGRHGWERFFTKAAGWSTPMAYYSLDLTNG